MNIICSTDLSNIVINNPKCLSDATAFRGGVMDMFYDSDPWFINILCSIIRSGFVDEMITSTYIDEFTKSRWEYFLEYNYGFDNEKIKHVLQVWLGAVALVKKQNETQQSAPSSLCEPGNKSVQQLKEKTVYFTGKIPEKWLISSELKSITFKSENFIDKNALNCKNLTFVNAPAFTARNVMRNQNIGPNITLSITGGFIGDNYFSSNEKLRNLNVCSDVQYIGRHAFENCTNLNKVTIDAKIKSIEACTFKGCTNLKEIVLPDTVEAIRYNAFVGCTHLKSVTLPSGLSYVEAGAFATGNNSKEIIFKGTKAQWEHRRFRLDEYFSVIHCINGDILLNNSDT